MFISKFRGADPLVNMKVRFSWQLLCPVGDAGEEVITLSHSELFLGILHRLRNHRISHDIILLPYAVHSITTKITHLP